MRESRWLSVNKRHERMTTFIQSIFHLSIKKRRIGESEHTLSDFFNMETMFMRTLFPFKDKCEKNGPIQTNSRKDN